MFILKPSLLLNNLILEKNTWTRYKNYPYENDFIDPIFNDNIRNKQPDDVI